MSGDATSFLGYLYASSLRFKANAVSFSFLE